MAAKPPPSEETIKTRILTHMNADHADSLSLYLQHHHKISSYRARCAKLTDISLTTLSLSLPPLLSLPSSVKQIYTVPITPPLESWTEARLRLVEMDASARSALGRSSIKMKKYKPPDRWWKYMWLSFVLIVFISFARRGNFSPDSWFAQTLGADFAAFCYRVQPFLWAVVVPVHVAEEVVMVRRLERFNVEFGCGVWWYWVLRTGVEGWTGLKAFGEGVAEEEGRREREGKGH